MDATWWQLHYSLKDVACPASQPGHGSTFCSYHINTLYCGFSIWKVLSLINSVSVVSLGSLLEPYPRWNLKVQSDTVHSNLKRALLLCHGAWPGSVAPWRCVCLHLGVCALVLTSMWRPEVKVGCLPQLLFIVVCFLSRVSLNLELADWGTGQPAPGILLSLSPWCWDHKLILTPWHLCGCWGCKPVFFFS